MWLQLVLSLIAITRGEIFDVTTIYDLTPDQPNLVKTVVEGRVHARTNALGLSLRNKNQDLLITVTDDQKLNLACDLSPEGNCSWSYGLEWEFDKYVSKELKQDKVSTMKNKPIYFDFKFYPYEYHNTIDIYVENGLLSTRKDVLFRFIPDDDDDDDDDDSYYYIGNNYTIGVYSMCRLDDLYYNYQFSIINKTEPFIMSCYEHLGNLYLNVERTANISFVFEDGYLRVYRELELLKSIIGFYDSEVHLRYFGPENSRYKPMLVVPKLVAKYNTSEMTSPLMMLEDIDKLCLTLVIECPQSTRQDVLLLMAEDLRHKQYVLLTVNNVKAGVNVIQRCANVEEISGPSKLILRNIMDVSVIRILTHNPEGEDVWSLEPVYKSSLLKDRTSNAPWISSSQTQFYTVDLPDETHNASSSPSNGPISCQNGGLMTEMECACPPGFTGMECQIACGPNGFGLDCGGKCSLESEMCQYQLMCNSITGCHCSPGFMGENCHKNCESGSYGNDCNQNCGNCFSAEPCNIYTGKCHSCQSGYIPPYCKTAYVYYASKPELTSLDYGTITVNFDTSVTDGVGIPKFYQIQYREKFQGTLDWYIHVSKKIEKHEVNKDLEEDTKSINSTQEKIEGLKSGLLYEVRVLLIDANFNLYDGEKIQSSEIVTKCYVPSTYDYKMKTENTASSITVAWSYKNETEHWCPVEFYEVAWKQGWKRKESSTSSEYFVLTNLLPHISLKFKVRAKTSGGYAPYSEISASTKYQGSSDVKDLQVVAAHSTSVQISWNPPQDDDRNLLYKLTYKCLQQPACLPGCDNATEGALTQDKTSVTLSPLLPFARYQVSVSPEGGLPSSIYVGTEETEPTEVPRPSVHAPLRTNTSLNIFWDSVPVCSSFFLGYNYQLLMESDSTKILDSGHTRTTNASFHHLTASTKYRVRVFVVTIAGWNPDAFLEITSSTSATVPTAVGNLTVYKKGRNMLGLRWVAPQSTYGVLKAFTILYSLGTEELSQIVNPTPCVPWPHLYCHTLEGLRTNRKYNISVSARNNEVAEDGEKAFVTAITKESPPMAPEGLKLINSSSTSINIEWRYPNLTNGVIRSFLISVEETDQFSQDNCCQIYPLIEITVQEEQLSYKSEVVGLHPASTYFVSVSAKTVGLGSAQSLVVYTKPPHLPFSALPHLQGYNEASWKPGEYDLLHVNMSNRSSNQSETYLPLIKAHLLLIVDQNGNSQNNESGVFNPQLNSLLVSMISKPFFFYQEYDENNLEIDLPLTTTPDMESAWGACPSPPPFTSKENYQLVAVQVSEYNNEFNVDCRYFSEDVTFDN